MMVWNWKAESFVVLCFIKNNDALRHDKDTEFYIKVVGLKILRGI